MAEDQTLSLEQERASLLAEALHASYAMEHRWKLACEHALRERDLAIQERDLATQERDEARSVACLCYWVNGEKIYNVESWEPLPVEFPWLKKPENE